MAMSQQSLPPVNKYTGSYTEDTEGDGLRLNAFEHEDANIAYDPLSANRRFRWYRRLGGVGDTGFRWTDQRLDLGDGARLLVAGWRTIRFA